MFFFFSSSDRISDFSIDDGADQHRLPARPAFLDQRRDRLVLLAAGPVDLVVVVLALDGDVGRHLDHFEAVDFAELAGLGHGGAGHAGEARVEAEVVLEGDRGERLVLALDGDVFLGFQRLMEALGIAAPSIMRPVNSSMMMTLSSLTM